MRCRSVYGGIVLLSFNTVLLIDVKVNFDPKNKKHKKHIEALSA